MAKPIYSAEATVTGGRANGHGRTTDGALDVQLRSQLDVESAVGRAAVAVRASARDGRLGAVDGLGHGVAQVAARVTMLPSGSATKAICSPHGMAVGSRNTDDSVSRSWAMLVSRSST